MGKDPAVLFYTSDFLTGTAYLTFEQKGIYIELLCLQHQNGHIPEDVFLRYVDTYDSPICKKFIKDDKGMFFNERMEEESIRRKNYSESRKKNISNRYVSTCVDTHVPHMKPHMETETETETINKKLEYFEMIFHQTLPVQHLASWRIWVEHCAEQGHPLKRMEATAQLKKLKDVPLEVDIGEVIKQTIESRHKGFKYIIEQLKDKKHGTGKKSDGAKPEELARIFTDYIVETGQG